jgi:hypothetical protein
MSFSYTVTTAPSVRAISAFANKSGTDRNGAKSGVFRLFTPFLKPNSQSCLGGRRFRRRAISEFRLSLRVRIYSVSGYPYVAVDQT